MALAHGPWPWPIAAKPAFQQGSQCIKIFASARQPMHTNHDPMPGSSLWRSHPANLVFQYQTPRCCDARSWTRGSRTFLNWARQGGPPCLARTFSVVVDETTLEPPLSGPVEPTLAAKVHQKVQLQRFGPFIIKRARELLDMERWRFYSDLCSAGAHHPDHSCTGTQAPRRFLSEPSHHPLRKYPPRLT